MSERGKPSKLETLKVMGNDLRKVPSGVRLLGRATWEASCEIGSMLLGMVEGYGLAQLTLSALAYSDKLPDPLKSKSKRDGANLGRQYGAICSGMQELLLYGLASMDFVIPQELNMLSDTAVSDFSKYYVGAKVTSNLIAGVVRWGMSAKERAVEDGRIVRGE